MLIFVSIFLSFMRENTMKISGMAKDSINGLLEQNLKEIFI